eukprot:11189857-Lingulodinium_polyedra.AAC.1
MAARRGRGKWFLESGQRARVIRCQSSCVQAARQGRRPLPGVRRGVRSGVGSAGEGLVVWRSALKA